MGFYFLEATFNTDTRNKIIEILICANYHMGGYGQFSYTLIKIS